MEGWIKLHRKIVDNPYYFSEPFTRSQAWIDLLILANHKDNFFYKRNIRVDISVGQVGYDLESLAKRWMWSRGKAERFLNALENDNQIVRQKGNVTTLISIVKYKDYQIGDKANSKPNDNANGHQTVKQIVKQTDTNNNVKNDNNEKNDNNISFSENSENLENGLFPVEAILENKEEKKKITPKPPSENLPSLHHQIIAAYVEFHFNVKGYKYVVTGADAKAVLAIRKFFSANQINDEEAIAVFQAVLDKYEQWEIHDKKNFNLKNIGNRFNLIFDKFLNPTQHGKQSNSQYKPEFN